MTDDRADITAALEAAEKALQAAAAVMIRDPALVATVGRRVALAVSHAHKARQKLARGLNGSKPYRDIPDDDDAL